jgi:uncharacterized SAM-binding protein YcdF (DUF218 family)
VLLLFIVLLLWVFRVQLLTAAGKALIAEDSPQKTEALVVLGGNSFERGSAALQLFKEGITQRMVCTGGNVPSALQAAGTPMYEAELTQKFLVASGVDSSYITVLTASTSTLEEAHEVLRWAQHEGVTELSVMSSTFHTGRVRRVFKKAFNDSGITVRVIGAPPLTYNTHAWWKSEEGLIMVNNEYMKSLYYLIKH